MTLYLDSASVDDARKAFALGFVSGITTNPTLIAETGRPSSAAISELCEIATGTVFYQLQATTIKGRHAEAEEMLAVAPGKVGLKIPCTLGNLRLAADFAARGHTVGITAIFSSAQVFMACQAGARYVLPYVNRSTRLLGDGIALVNEMRKVIDACASGTEIIAASIKSGEEAIATLLAGAHHLTLPLPLIESMGQHELSDQAIQDFARS
jgi:transaldolase